MNAKEFVKKIMMTYTDAPETLPEQIGKFLEGFDDQQIAAIFSAFEVSAHSRYTPKTAYPFAEIAKEKGIEKRKESHLKMWRTCDTCGAVFSFKSHGCPSCRERPAKMRPHIGPVMPSAMTHVKPDCWSCAVYRPGRRPMGCTCEDWGKRDNGMRRRGEAPAIQPCSVCPCAGCCAEELASRETDKARLNLLTGKAGEDVKKAVERISGARTGV